jgi:phosphoglycolate phosphatase
MTQLQCVLFDLDGTLLDTAPDLIACLQEALQQHGFASVNADLVKPQVSFGALAMIKSSVASHVSETEQNAILDTMLSLYENNIARHTVFFEGMEAVLEFIETRGLRWGIVTNKRQRFTTPLLAALQLDSRVACAISGDSTPNPKPHVEPMLTACAQVGVEPQQCVYIGDAAHDIIAGNNANMHTLAAIYGYLKAGDEPHNWGANALIESPSELLRWLQSRLA